MNRNVEDMRLLTVDGAMGILGISKGAAHSHAARKDHPEVQMRGAWHFDYSSIPACNHAERPERECGTP